MSAFDLLVDCVKDATKERDELADALGQKDAEIEQLRKGLQFYALAHHMGFDNEAGLLWEDVSGEPPNWLQRIDSDHYEMIEDGTVAKMVLAGEAVTWDEEPVLAGDSCPDCGKPIDMDNYLSLADHQKCKIPMPTQTVEDQGNG